MSNLYEIALNMLHKIFCIEAPVLDRLVVWTWTPIFHLSGFCIYKRLRFYLSRQKAKNKTFKTKV